MTIKLTLSRDEIAMGDDPGEPIRREVPDDTTVAQALTLHPQLHHGFTWVAYDGLGKPLAAVHDGRVRYVVAPEARLKERGVTSIRYRSAYHHDVDELTAGLRAGGIPGPMSLRLLQQPRNRLLIQLGTHRTEQAQHLLKLTSAGHLDIPALLQLAGEVDDHFLAFCVRYWADTPGNPLWQVTERCSLALFEHGYYDRQRALETRATTLLPPAPGGWDYEPVALGLHLSVIGDVPIHDSQFRRDLATLAELLT